MSEFICEPGYIIRYWEKTEVFYHANLKPGQTILDCIRPATEMLKKDLEDDDIVNLILWVQKGDNVSEYDPDEIEEILK